VHEAHCSCFVACLALFAYRVPHWQWNLAVFDVSSQGHDLVGVHFSLIKFRLSPKAELDIDESRQVIPLVPFLLETLPTLPPVSPYRAPGLYSKHVNRDRSGETLHGFPPREQSTASRWSPFLAYLTETPLSRHRIASRRIGSSHAMCNEQQLSSEVALARL
jgi:hypothetical protein